MKLVCCYVLHRLYSAASLYVSDILMRVVLLY